MPVRLPLPVISVGAVAALVGLALGIGLGGAADRPHGERGAADPSRNGDPDRRQTGGDLPPMDFEGRVASTSPSPSRTTTTTSPASPASTAPTSTTSPSESALPRTDEVTSAVGVTPTPELPPLPTIPEVPASSLVEVPPSSALAGT